MFPVKYRYFFTLLIAFNAASQTPQIVVPVGHTQGIISSRFSPDGKYIATSSRDNTIKIWDIKTGRLLHTIATGKIAVSIFSFSNASRYIMTQSSVDSILTVWDIYLKSNKPVFLRNKYFSNQTTFSPDEKNLLLQTDTTVEVWDINAAKKIRSFLIKSKLSSYRKIDAFNISHNSKWVAASFADTIYIWEISTGQLLKKVYNEISYPYELNFSADSKFIYLRYSGRLLKINVNEWKAVNIFNMAGTSFYFSVASANNRFVILESKKYYYKKEGTDSVPDYDAGYKYQLILVDCEKGSNYLLKPDSFPNAVMNYCIDNDARQIIINTGKKIFVYKRHENQLKLQTTIPVSDKFYYPSIAAENKGNFLALYSSTVAAVYTNTGKPIYILQGNMSFDSSQYFSNNGKYIYTSYGNYRKNAWNIYTGKTEKSYDDDTSANIIAPNHELYLPYAVKDTANGSFNLVSGTDSATVLEVFKEYRYREISPHNKYAGFYAVEDSSVYIWDIKTQQKTTAFKNELGTLGIREFSNNDSLLVCGDNNSEYVSPEELNKMWDDLQAELDAMSDPDSASSKKRLAAIDVKPKKRISCLKVYSLKEQKQIFEFIDSSELYLRTHAYFSGRAKNLMGIVAGKIHVWETKSWKEIFVTEDVCRNDEPSWSINAKGSKIVITCKGTASLYETYTSKKLFEIPGAVSFATFSADDKYILTESEDKQLRIWNPATGKLVYTYYALENGSYLTTDEYGRYDGTEDARKKLYYVCGDEVIDLDQFKDQLWVPDLAARIMKGDTINAPKLSDLNICGLTPVVEEMKETKEAYQFHIAPRSGGLGETIVSVNNIETLRYNPAQLVKDKTGYILTIKRKDLQQNFLSGEKNNISVKALTKTNDISSRSTIVEEEIKEAAAKSIPNLYAVMVGVSDYKGTGLDLRYAAKDADDFAAAAELSAKKLLNTDGEQHVFVYRLHTGERRDLFPEKNSIKKVIAEIGIKARPNDILLVFFAGHGKWDKNKNQFFFLTADASKETINDAIADVGISTQELSDWIQPAKLKAQKRILIFDACNSGQAIKDFVKIGQEEEKYLAARDDEKAQQIKAVEKLNDKSGLFILSASASNQYAYEMGKYSQGLLTYSLLKAIKEQPEVLEANKYLSVYRWFDAAEKTVSDVAAQNGNQQQPQLVGTTSFAIGVVDDEVRNKIVLPNEKPVFGLSNFQNSNEDIAADDLGLNKMLNNILSDVSVRGMGSQVSYSPVESSAFILSGRYTVSGKTVSVKINVRQNNEIKFKFELSGNIDELSKLAADITDKAIEWAVSKK